MTSDRPGELHVTGRRGLPLPTGWHDGFLVPFGVRIEFVDLGRRCDVHVVCGGRSVTVLADLAAGLALVDDGVDGGELMALALTLLARRKAACVGSRAGAADESPLREVAVIVPRARWVTIT